MITRVAFTAGLELGAHKWTEVELASLDPFALESGLVITAMQQPHDLNILERAICVRLAGDPNASPDERSQLIERYAYFDPNKDRSRQYVGAYPALGALGLFPSGYLGTASDYHALVFPFNRSRVHLSPRSRDHQNLRAAALGFSILLFNRFEVQPSAEAGIPDRPFIIGRSLREVCYWKVDEEPPAPGIRRVSGGRLATAEVPPRKDEPPQEDYPERLARFVLQIIAASRPRSITPARQ